MTEREKDDLLASVARNITALIDEIEQLRRDVDNAHWLIRAMLLANGGQVECKPEHYKEARENKALTHGYGTGGVVLSVKGNGPSSRVYRWTPTTVEPEASIPPHPDDPPQQSAPSEPPIRDA